MTRNLCHLTTLTGYLWIFLFKRLDRADWAFYPSFHAEVHPGFLLPQCPLPTRPSTWHVAVVQPRSACQSVDTGVLRWRPVRAQRMGHLPHTRSPPFRKESVGRDTGPSGQLFSPSNLFPLVLPHAFLQSQSFSDTAVSTVMCSASANRAQGLPWPPGRVSVPTPPPGHHGR